MSDIEALSVDEGEFATPDSGQARLVALFDDSFRREITDLEFQYTYEGKTLGIREQSDGIMHDVTVVTGRAADQMMTKLKTVSRISTGMVRKPEEGRYRHQITGTTDVRDIRVTIFPSRDGETVSMRLPRLTKIIPFDELSMTDHSRERVEQLLGRANGLILVAGPMGSGKSTSMYSVVDRLGGNSRVVFTVEDPVETVLAGVTQIEINEEAENTFEAALKSLRRSNLQVLMIGEVRDEVTSKAAIEISNAGAKVISSIHSNDSLAAVDALIGMSKEDPKRVMQSLRGVISQRLLRKLDHWETDENGVQHAVYKGMTPLHEVLVVDEPLVEAITSGARIQEQREIANRGGMRTLRENAAGLVVRGITTEEEVIRVLGNA